ncbi:MAG: hypothetical protein M4D85_11020 [Actinomycetota bacterium]|nr:hypothetical protein [Actinomycetota bacterium]
MNVRPPREMPKPTGDLRELREINKQLVHMRQRLNDLRFPHEDTSTTASASAGGLAALAMLTMMAAVFAVVEVDQSPWLLLACGPVAVVLVLTAVVVHRRGARDTRRRRTRTHRVCLLARNAELWEALRPEAGEGLPLPPDRQPILYAYTWHNRFGLGQDPEVALRTMPAGAGATRVLFHRWGGWNGIALGALALGTLTFGTVGLVLRKGG